MWTLQLLNGFVPLLLQFSNFLAFLVALLLQFSNFLAFELPFLFEIFNFGFNFKAFRLSVFNRALLTQNSLTLVFAFCFELLNLNILWVNETLLMGQQVALSFVFKLNDCHFLSQFFNLFGEAQHLAFSGTNIGLVLRNFIDGLCLNYVWSLDNLFILFCELFVERDHALVELRENFLQQNCKLLHFLLLLWKFYANLREFLCLGVFFPHE